MESFNPIFSEPERQEMIMYGLDPDNLSEADLKHWLDTTPPQGIPKVVNYSEDIFEFGSPSKIES